MSSWVIEGAIRSGLVSRYTLPRCPVAGRVYYIFRSAIYIVYNRQERISDIRIGASRYIRVCRYSYALGTYEFMENNIFCAYTYIGMSVDA